MSASKSGIARQSVDVRMADEVRVALAQDPPCLPTKYLYDDRGSALYERILALPEYYQARTEEQLLERIAPALVARLRPRELVELGAGASRKIRSVLTALKATGLERRLTLFDVNASVLAQNATRLRAEDPALHVRVVGGDFLQDLTRLGPSEGGRLVLFFAGTIGNIHPDEVTGFLRRLGAQLVSGDHLLVGIDLVKDPQRLEAAYNDSQGVTAAFNRNILTVVNERLGADFDPGSFEHVAFYDAQRQWIEMRLRAVRPMRVYVPRARMEILFRRGDEIRTEISAKYTVASFASRLVGSGFGIAASYTDPEELFGLVLLARGDAP